MVWVISSNRGNHIDILNSVLPTFWWQFGEGLSLFQHCNATVLPKARSINEWFSQFGVEEFYWPTESWSQLHLEWTGTPNVIQVLSSVSDLTKGRSMQNKQKQTSLYNTSSNLWKGKVFCSEQPHSKGGWKQYGHLQCCCCWMGTNACSRVPKYREGCYSSKIMDMVLEMRC